MLGSCAGLTRAFTPPAFSLQLCRLCLRRGRAPSAGSLAVFFAGGRPAACHSARLGATPSGRPPSSARAQNSPQFNTGTARFTRIFSAGRAAPGSFLYESRRTRLRAARALGRAVRRRSISQALADSSRMQQSRVDWGEAHDAPRVRTTYFLDFEALKRIF